MNNDLLITMFTALTVIAVIALVSGAIARRPGRPAVVIAIVAGWQVNLAALVPATATAVAVAGKFGGTIVGARHTGIPNRQAAVLGALMNTRGLTGLIVLTAGRQTGLVDTSRCTVLAVMALLTTVAIGPLLTRLVGKPGQPGQAAAAPPAPMGLVGAVPGPSVEHRMP